MPCTVFPMNLDWDTVDINGIPLNPDWCYHKDDSWAAFGIPPRHPNPRSLCGNPEGVSYCTDQQTYTDRGFLCGFASDYWYIPGHWNWNIPATYEGHVCWAEKTPNGQDDDYNIDLLTPGGAGLTVGNNGYLLLEFDSDETVDHWTSRWWTQFHSAVNDDVLSDIVQDLANHPPADRWPRAKAMIDGKRAIVSGLLGLDCAHPSVAAELHPVWTLAIQTDVTRNSERWPMFVRNWGNEGMCSRAQHYLGLQDYTFALPWRPGATGVNVTNMDFRRNSDKISGFISARYGEAVFVRFQLPPPREKGMVNGSVDLHWDGEPVLEIGPPPCGHRAAKTETFVGKLIEQMSPQQREIFLSKLPERRVTPRDTPFNVTRVDSRHVAERLGRSELPRVWSEIDLDKVGRDYQLMSAFNTAFAGTIPGVPSVTSVEDE